MTLLGSTSILLCLLLLFTKFCGSDDKHNFIGLRKKLMNTWIGSLKCQPSPPGVETADISDYWIGFDHHNNCVSGFHLIAYNLS